MTLMQGNYHGYVYRIIINNEESHLNGCTYIGRHRYNEEGIDPKYFGSSYRLKREYFPYYNKEGLNIEIICESDSKEELILLEEKYIKLEKELQGDKCLNITDSGDGGDNISNLSDDRKNEIKQKQSQASLTMWQNPKHRKKHVYYT